MNQKLTPEDLQKNPKFELLTEIPHSRLKEFVIEREFDVRKQ